MCERPLLVEGGGGFFEGESEAVRVGVSLLLM
jgi:hypothetical protein